MLEEFLNTLTVEELNLAKKALKFLDESIDSIINIKKEHPDIVEEVEDEPIEEVVMEEVKPVDEQEELEKALQETGSLTKTRTVEPRIYHVDINPSDWEWDFDNSAWKFSKEIYTDKYQLRESSIISININEERMIEPTKDPMERVNIESLIDDIYNYGLIKLIAKDIIGTFYYNSEERPKFTICIDISELPFLDCPASSMGL